MEPVKGGVMNKREKDLLLKILLHICKAIHYKNNCSGASVYETTKELNKAEKLAKLLN